MANVNLINDVVLKEGMRTFRNASAFVNAIKPQHDSSNEFKGAKAGESIRLQIPQEFTTRSTFTADVQDVEQKSETLTKALVEGVDVRFSSAEMDQDNVDGFVQNKVGPALATLAAKVDNRLYGLFAPAIANAVDLPTTALDRRDVLNAGIKLDNGLAPRGNRSLIVNPQGMGDLVNDSSGLFNAATQVSQQYKDGIIDMQQTLGFNIGMSQNVTTHTTGAFNTAYEVKTASVNGATTLDIDTGANSILTGDIFTVATVFEVNALTKQSTGKLKQFVVTADSAGGDVIISISPEIISEGPYQNVDSLPAVNDAVLFLGTASTAYPQAMAFDPGFAAIGFTDLSVPRSAVYGGRKVEDGVSIRCIEWYDGVNDQEYLRFDVLFGGQVIIPRWGCRLYSF